MQLPLFHRLRFATFSVWVVSVSFCSLATAENVLVNGDFELPPLLNPNQTDVGEGETKILAEDPNSPGYLGGIGAIPNWMNSFTDVGYGSGFRDAGIGRAPLDGRNGPYAFINNWETRLSQVSTLQLAPAQKYSASIDLTLPGGPKAGRIELWAGVPSTANPDLFPASATLLAVLSVGTPDWPLAVDQVLPTDTWTQLSFDYTAPASGALIGQPLTLSVVTTANSAGATYWDNASLMAVPEPGGWNAPAGVKNGNDSAVEAADPYVASQLIVRGGSLGFLGSASIHGPVTISEQNGWGSPVVTVAGTFEVAGGNLAVLNSAASLHTIGNYRQTAGAFQITDGASFQTDGTFDHVGSQFEVTGGSTFSVGNLTSGAVDTGFVTINGGSDVTVRTLSMNQNVLVTDAGSSLHTTGNYKQAAGAFQITDGASFQTDGTFDYLGGQFQLSNNSMFTVAGGSGSVGAISIESGTELTISPLTAGATVSVSDDGHTMSVIGDVTPKGSVVTVENGHDLDIIGILLDAPGTRSTLQVLGGSSVSATLSVVVDGELRVAGAGSTLTTDVGVAIGESENPTGTANLIFEDSATVQTGFLFVGNANNDSVATIRSGAHLTTTQSSGVGYSGIATRAGARGDLTIKDSGTRWDSANQIQVGSGLGSNGKLSILNGSVVVSNKASSPSASSGIIGVESGAMGSVSVNGLGSRWSQDGGLSAGFRGDGTLHVEASSLVESVDGFVARFAGSSGQVTVDGSGSEWRISRALYVGGAATAAGGTGKLSISSQGVVTVGDTIHVWSTGEINVSAGGIVNSGSGPLPLPGTVRVGPGGALSGAGTIVGNVVGDGGTGNAINSAVIAPGPSAGVLTIDGSFTQVFGSVLEIDVGGVTPGAQHDKVVVTGSSSLGGELDLPIINGYVPQPGDSVTILTSPNVTGTFASVFAPDIAQVNSNVALQVIQSAAEVQVHFVAPISNTEFVSNGTVVDWTNPIAWSSGINPDTRHIVGIHNPVGVDQRVTVQNSNSFVHQLDVVGGNANTMTLNITNERSLSAMAGVTVDHNAILALGSETSNGYLVTPKATIRSGAVLKGNGRIGPANDIGRLRDKRNLLTSRGMISPGYSVGHLQVSGDYEQDASGTLVIELESPSTFDKFVVAGEAQLGGTLDVSLLNYSPQSGDTFDILDWTTLTATFDTVNLPVLGGGLKWNLNQLYTIGALTVTGVLGDLNSDNSVDAADAGLMFANWGLSGEGDLNLDGIVDAADAGEMFAAWTGDGGVYSIPEPSARIILQFGFMGLLATKRWKGTFKSWRFEPVRT